MDTLAGMLWKADQEVWRAEEALFDILERIGFGDSWSDWGRDPYDSSLELYGVPPDARLTKEGAQALIDAGFWIIYVNHSDGSETTYSTRGENHHVTEGYRKRPEEPSQMKLLRNRVKELERRIAND